MKHFLGSWIVYDLILNIFGTLQSITEVNLIWTGYELVTNSIRGKRGLPLCHNHC